MQLIYRGHFYIYTTTCAQPAYQPYAINWRYRLLETSLVEMLPLNTATTVRSFQPAAINWRYEIPAEV